MVISLTLFFANPNIFIAYVIGLYSRRILHILAQGYVPLQSQGLTHWQQSNCNTDFLLSLQVQDLIILEPVFCICKNTQKSLHSIPYPKYRIRPTVEILKTLSLRSDFKTNPLVWDRLQQKTAVLFKMIS